MKKPSLLKMLFLINILNNTTNSFIVFRLIQLSRTVLKKYLFILEAGINQIFLGILSVIFVI